MNQAIQAVQSDAPLARTGEAELTVQDLVAQVRKVQEVMQAVMKDGEHYGVIPGTKSKPTLMKPGAEKLCLLFRLDPEYELIERAKDGDHLSVTARCVLFHAPTGQRRGSGLGSCSSRESKYAYRKGERKCPKCGAEAILKSKNEREGWFCWRKKDGCGATFKQGDAAAIENQTTGRVANPDLADTYNTVLKMATKRALIAAVLNVTAASDIFTQDLEDLSQDEEPARAQRQQSVPEEMIGNEPPDSSPDAAEERLQFSDMERRLKAIEERIAFARTYDEALQLRSELGSRGKQSPLLKDMQEAGPDKRLISGAEYKALCKTWARCDRQLEKLETKLRPSAEDSFMDPPDDEREPGSDG